MKKENYNLKRALEEAAKIELEALPEEKQIIRPYSDKFEKEMNTLIGKEETSVIRKRPRVKFAALIAAVLIICLAGTAGAVNLIRLWSPEWHEQIKENVMNAATSEEVQAFDEAFAKADDYFANLTRKTDGATPLMLDYSEFCELDITVEKDGYTFYIDKIVKGQYKINKCISGNPIEDDAVYQWVVEEGYFMIAEVSRTDGKKLTDEDKVFDLSIVSADFRPLDVQACLRGFGISEIEDYKWCYAFDVTKAMAFANHDLGVVVIENPNSFGGMITYKEVYLDKNNLPAFRDEIEGTNFVIKFNIDEKFADEEKVEAYAELYGMNLNLDLYRK